MAIEIVSRQILGGLNAIDAVQHLGKDQQPGSDPEWSSRLVPVS
jgi:hypothetical protein